MEDLTKYKDWLGRAQGVNDPSLEQLERFRKKADRHRPYGSVLDLLFALWLDSRSNFRGTTAYLAFQGLDGPSGGDLINFHNRLKRAVAWRLSITLVLVIAWVVFARSVGLRLFGPNVIIPVAIVVSGLGVSSGTKLTRASRTGEVNPRSPSR